MSLRKQIERKLILDWREGKSSWEQQSFEEMDQELEDAHQQLP